MKLKKSCSILPTKCFFFKLIFFRKCVHEMCLESIIVEVHHLPIAFKKPLGEFKNIKRTIVLLSFMHVLNFRHVNRHETACSEDRLQILCPCACLLSIREVVMGIPCPCIFLWLHKKTQDSNQFNFTVWQ